MVVSDVVQVWFAPVTEPGQEMKIVLPEPASLVVRYDIPGDTEQVQLRLELATWKMPEWAGIIADPSLCGQTNGQIVLTNLAPGTYHFARNKRLSVAGDFDEAFCYRATLVPKAGRSGTCIVSVLLDSRWPGEIAGFQNSGLSAVFIYVRSAEFTGK